MTRRGRKEDLSGEDAVLWDHVTRTVTRMGVRAARVRNGATAEAETTAAASMTNGQSHAAAPSAPKRTTPPAVPPTNKRGPAPAGIEPRKTRRIARGRDEIEARIDLHGMRQAEAHGALRGFLARSYANGARLVLVITGKGRPADQAADTPFDLFQDRDRGVLRRVVPQWLADPELRAIVVGYTSAHARHGGEGAFYVQLRNRDKQRG
jgi:DNA-nicking Smr family endonuclease